MDFVQTLKLRFSVGDPNLPERRKRGTINSSREEEEVDAQVCPCGKAIESLTHVIDEGVYKEERDVFEEMMREVDECDMEGFDTLDSEKTIAILGDIDGGQRRRKGEGIRLALRCM